MADEWQKAIAKYLMGDGVINVPQGQTVSAMPGPRDRSDRAAMRASINAINVPDTPGPRDLGDALMLAAGGPILSGIGKGIGWAGRAMTGSPRATSGAIGAALLATPSEANQETPYDKQMREYSAQQAAIRQSVDKLRAERQALLQQAEIEKKSGEGPRFREAMRKLSDWDATNNPTLNQQTADLTALSSRMDAYDAENSPAAVRKRNAETPTKELFPGATMATQAALAGGGLLASMAMRGRNAGRFNAEIADLAQGLKAANGAGASAEASAISNKLSNMSISGPSRKGTVAPTIAGFELGAFAPTAADYYRSGGDPSSPLYKKAVQSVVGGEGIKNVLGYEVPGTDLAARMAMAGLLGYGASKIGNTLIDASVGRRALPQTEMIKAGSANNGAGGVPSPGGPGGVGGGPAGVPQPQPQPVPQGGAGVQPPSPPPYVPYDPAVHGSMSRQYLDELLTTNHATRNQSMSQTFDETVPHMVNQLQGRYVAAGGPMVDPVNLAARAGNTFEQAGLMHQVMQQTNSQITNPRMREEILNAITGRPWLLGVPAGAAAAEPTNNLLAQYYGGQQF